LDPLEHTERVSRKNSAEAHLPTLSISPAIGAAELLREFVTGVCFAVVICAPLQRYSVGLPALRVRLVEQDWRRTAGPTHQKISNQPPKPKNAGESRSCLKIKNESPWPAMKAEYIV
jgi:hypothetical protein